MKYPNTAGYKQTDTAKESATKIEPVRTTPKRQRHGGTHTPEHHAWRDMRSRCYSPKNPRYSDYGGRGIAVCDRWADFALFLKDMGKRPGAGYSIERKDNGGDYSPSNCYWATYVEQNNNLRTNVLLTFQGQSQTMAQWSRVVNLPYGVIRHRRALGWSVERLLTTPKQKNSRTDGRQMGLFE